MGLFSLARPARDDCPLGLPQQEPQLGRPARRAAGLAGGRPWRRSVAARIHGRGSMQVQIDSHCIRLAGLAPGPGFFGLASTRALETLNGRRYQPPIPFPLSTVTFGLIISFFCFLRRYVVY